MVDPRIYRTGLALVAIAVIVFAFSLQDQPGAVTTTLAPGQYFGSAYATMTSLAHRYPDRSPGSPGDSGLARRVQSELRGIRGFAVSSQTQLLHTARGTEPVETVTALRAGLRNGTVVVVSHRDATGAPATADLSGTAVMLELARALAGETLHRSLLLVSTSGQVGAAGATALAKSLTGQPVDAVLVLGNLAGALASRPLVVPWSNRDLVAPPALRNTVARYVAQQTGLASGGYGIGGQLARLSFPFSLTEQAPFVSRGIPAVLLSLSGDRPTAAHEPLGPPSEISSLGAAVLQSVNALDAGPAVPAPSAYLLISGKVVPLWAIRLLVLTLILPVAAVALDALARARRRGHSLTVWIGWVLAGAVPFLVGLAAVLVARVTGVLSAYPAGGVGAHGIPITGADAAVLIAIVLAIVLSFVFVRPACLALLSRAGGSGRRAESPAADAAAVALTLVMCATSVVVWLVNPFSAALLVPALHLWLWLAQPAVRARRVAVIGVAVAGIVPAALVVVYYAHAYGLSPLGLAWSGVLLLAGGQLLIAGVYWSVALGCFASALVIALRAARAAGPAAVDPVVTVRGPASYAGPGSLGGTESAIRR